MSFEPRSVSKAGYTLVTYGSVNQFPVVEPEDAGVVVFSYPRYCRYRAVAARLEGLQADWLRDSLVAALGGYAAPTTNTRILYCKVSWKGGGILMG